MRNQLVFAVLLASLLYGCGYEAKTEPQSLLESVADTNFFNNQELMILENAVHLTLKTYQDSGISGMQAYIEQCYDIESTNQLTCVGADYTAHLIDKNISIQNNFPLDKFFYENRVISRLILTKDFEGEDIFVLFTASAAIKNRVSEILGGILLPEKSGVVMFNKT